MSLRWKFRETADSEYGTAFYAGLKITVQDCDGDWSRWQIEDTRSKNVWGKTPTLASGDCHTTNYETDPYHFNFAMDVAEQTARIIGRARRAAEARANDSTPERSQ